MLHDEVQARVCGQRVSTAVERRRHPRVPFPAEAVIIWHHDPEHPVRLRVVEVSDGGLRIRSTIPLPHGLTGVAMRLLPEGNPLERSIMVVWCHPTESDAEAEDELASRPVDAVTTYDIGMRWF